TLTDYQFVSRLAYIFYGLNFIALLVVQFKGGNIAGVSRWINLGFFHYQPSETMKVIIVLTLARYLSARSYPKGMQLKDLVVPSLLVLIPFALIAKQPDLGSASILAAIGFCMMLFVRVQSRLIIAAVILTVVAAPMAWNFGLKEYQRDRIRTFLSPNA